MNCSICSHSDLRKIGTRNFVPDDYHQSAQLIGIDDFECMKCGHVQSKNFGGSAFLSTLYNHEKLKEQWAPDGSTPYRDIAQTSFSFITRLGRSADTVYDFGAGDLEVLNEGHQLGLWDRKQCLGIDFNITENKHGTPTISIDLSKKFSEELLNKTNQKKFDLGFCTHVLEHLEEPYQFLTEVLKIAHQDSVLYVEVPDNHSVTKSDMVTASLYCIQHIHFYSLDTLIQLTQRAGWEVLEARSSRYGWVPRICLTLKPKLENKTSKLYNEHTSYLDKIGNDFKDKITRSNRSGSRIAIWGLGSDFHLYINKESSLLNEIDQNVMVIDSRFAGKKVSGFDVKDSSFLYGFTGEIYCTPFTENSRETMRSIAKIHFPNAKMIFAD
jgi:hypothetical protein